MGQVLQLAVALLIVDCGECGGSYAINQQYHEQCRNHGKSWTCPYCKTGWGFSGNGEFEKVKKALEEEKARHQRTISRENEERTEKERLARKLKRVGRGVCPECNRSFANLARHMNCKHAKDAQ